VASLPKAAFLPVALVTIAVSIAALTAAVTSGDDGSAAPATSATTAAPAGPAVAATIIDFAFSPEPVTVKAGQTVTWTNKDPFAHSIKSGDGSFDSEPLGPGASYSAPFSTPGTYAYLCGIHNSMTGTVVVEP
jgi:plastocyanin